MLVSTSHKFIFLAVPKTASSSIQAELERLADTSLSAKFPKHVTANKLRKEAAAGRLASYKKFAFVRNPYSWVYSWFTYRQRDGLHKGTHPFHERHTAGKTIDEFGDSVIDEEVFLTQSDFICTHSGKLLIDYVGRYENLDEDFRTICEQLGLVVNPLGVVNASDRDSFHMDVLNAASRKTINRYFHADFELFGYSKQT